RYYCTALVSQTREKIKALLVGIAAMACALSPVLFRFEYWPLSSYPIFSVYPSSNTIHWPKLVDEKQDLLNQDIDVWPMDSFRFYALVQDLLYAQKYREIEKLMTSLSKAQKDRGITGSRLKGKLTLVQTVWDVKPGFDRMNPIQEYSVLEMTLPK